MVLPTIAGSASKRRFQKAEERTTVAVAPGRSSLDAKTRPIMGCTPNVRKKFHEHHAASICSGSFPPSAETLKFWNGETIAISASPGVDRCHSEKLPAST